MTMFFGWAQCEGRSRRRRVPKTETLRRFRLKAIAQIGKTKWATAIWFDTKLDTYILPIRAEVRRKEGLEKDQHVPVMVWV